MRSTTLFFFLSIFLINEGLSQIDARMFRYPDVSETQICFVYAGDIWVAPKGGGLAHQLSSPKGEESFPRFSPDGKQIAYSANYDGNPEVYTINVQGGLPQRITHHPMSDRLVDWHPEGQNILIASSRESGRQRFNQFYLAPKTGGMPDKLPIPYGEFGTYSPDGTQLAYMPKTRDFRTWKRYRGGGASDIWLFNLGNLEASNISDHEAVDGHPMWHNNTIYFLSDRGKPQRQNIWAYDIGSDKIRQVTFFTDFDIHFPAIGPKDIVFEAGGKLYLLDLETEKHNEVKVEVRTDMSSLLPRKENISRQIQYWSVSPDGKRAIFGARGDLFSVPAEHGFILNLSQSSGSAERFPAWSPNGKHLAYWSDKSGEYELYLREPGSKGKEEQVTNLGKGYRYNLYWSPDSKKIAFMDQTQTIHILDVASRQLETADKTVSRSHGGRQGFSPSWSSDSKWLTYDKMADNRQPAIFLYDAEKKAVTQVTKGYYNDYGPVFDPDGKYLYFYTDRNLRAQYGSLDGTWIYPNASHIAAVSLTNDVPSPLSPRNDTVAISEESGERDQESGKKNGEDKKKDKDEKDKPVEIALEDFESRLVLLPPRAGNYGQLSAVSGKVIYIRYPVAGSSDRKRPLMAYDLKKRKEETLVSDISSYEIAAGGKKMIISQRSKYGIVDIKPNQKIKEAMRTGELEMTIDPRAEWTQMFNEVWRRYRDIFYDPNLHQVDWDGMRKQYGDLLEDVVTRWDVNFVMRQLVSELSAGHTYVSGGDVERSGFKQTGLLGVDWSLENGAYRIKRIAKGASWDHEARSPLSQPGVDIKSGDYILAVNGIPLDTKLDPWASFQGLANKTVTLTVNSNPSFDGARDVIIKTMSSEARLRHLEWIEKNRKRVEEASNGRIGYLYMPNTGGQGQTELIRQFYSQMDKEGFVIDERFNSGGQLSDRFIELLNRPTVFWLHWRNGIDHPWPMKGNNGPKAMLINGWSVSGGDAFPFAFQELEIGPIIGERTTGALIGPATGHSLIDGGRFTVPGGRLYSNKGKWFAEGYGIVPDYPVVDHPTQLAKGVDPQLEKAIEVVLEMLEVEAPKAVKRPEYEDRREN